MPRFFRNPFVLTLLSLAPWGVVGIGVLFAFYTSIQPRPPAPVAATGPAGLPTATCPIVVSEAFQEAAGPIYLGDQWDVYTYDGAFEAPKVDVEVLPGLGPNGEAVCRLTFSGAPVAPTGEIDWRMGNIADVDGLRGKTVHYRSLIRSDRPIKFDTSYVYSHFGTPIQVAAIPNLSDEWLERSITADVPENATVAEFWYRLVLGTGTIVPGSGTIDFIPMLDIVD